MQKKHFISDLIYKEIMRKMPITTVDVVFLNKDKILLFKRNNEPVKNVFFTMGGRIIKGESFIECAERQVKTELGIKIDPKKLKFIGVTQDNHKNSTFKGISYYSITIFYTYEIEKAPDLKLDFQHSEYKWFSMKDKTLHPHIKERIKQIHEQHATEFKKRTI